MYYILENKIPKKVLLPEYIDWWCVKSNQKSKRVAYNQFFEKTVEVSTVFLGLNTNFDIGEPLVFETMIFGGEHNHYINRYSTWKQAEKGHKKAIQLLFKEVANVN